MIRTLWKSRDLLVNLVRRDLTVRYKSTVLGFFWSFAKPLAYVGIYHLIFGRILKIGLADERIPYALHVLTGVLPWTFFAGASAEAMNSILANANLVKKVKLPLEVFPVAAVLGQAVHFALAMVVVLAVMLFFGLVPGASLLLLPLAFLVQILFISAVALLLSSLNVFYRDVGSLWEVISAAWFYATPIIYPAYQATQFLESKGWGALQWLYLANPMTAAVLAYRRLLLYGATSGGGEDKLEISDGNLALAFALSAAASLALLAVARLIFARLSRRFADEL